MSAFGMTPLSEENGTGLGIAFVRVEMSPTTGEITNPQFFNPSTQVYEPGPRVDSAHVVPLQRLSSDPASIDNFIQLAPVPRAAMGNPNVIAIIYYLDPTGKATSIYRTYGHSIAVALGSVNNTCY